jgi:hypothetical protein
VGEPAFGASDCCCRISADMFRFTSGAAIRCFQDRQHLPCERQRHKGRDCVADLPECRVHRSAETEPVRERLEARGLADRDRPGLLAVVMSELNAAEWTLL